MKKSSDVRRRERQNTAPNEINKSHDFFAKKVNYFATNQLESGSSDIQAVKASKKFKKVTQIECKFNTERLNTEESNMLTYNPTQSDCSD